MKKNATIALFILIIIPFIIEPLYLHCIKPDSTLRITFNSDVNVEAFNDSSEGGCSVIDTFYRNLQDSSYTIEFTLDGCSAEPFAGLKFIHRNNKTFDLSGYDTVIVVAQLNYMKDVCIDFRTPIKGHTVDSLPITYRFNRYDITCSENPQSTHIPFKELFRTPDFWFKKEVNRQLAMKSPGKERYNRVSEIVIQNTSTETGKKTVLTIYKIELRKNIKAQKKHWLLLCLFYYLLIGLFFIIYTLLKKSSSPVTLKPDPENIVTEWMKIQQFIETHYREQLVIETVSNAVGLTPTRITHVIKGRFGYNFRTLLNHTRMLEAQRQLRETDRNISEISYAVGYSSPPNFNRVFRNLYNTTPLEYRRMCAKTDSADSLPLFPNERKNPSFKVIKRVSTFFRKLFARK